MADVTDRSRAQMLLVGALSLATVFILLSLLLNSVIYTENLATRRTNVDADSAVTYRLDARAGVGDTVQYVNRNGDESYLARHDDYEQLLDEWRRLRSNVSAVDGRYTNVTPAAVYNGTRIVDDDDATTMTPQNGSPSWTVAPGVRSRNLVLDVNTTSATATASDVGGDLSSGTDPDVFRVVVDGDTNTSVAVYENTSGDLELLVYDGAADEYDTCAAPNGRVDVFRERADGQYCDALTKVSPSGTYDVHFEDADLATGTYSLAVDRLETPLRNASNAATHGNQCTAAFAASNASTPYTTPAIYSTNVTLDFVSADARYETSERIAPAEHGDPPSAPRFESVEVNESDTNPGNFVVDWSVADPDSDLSNVQVAIGGGGNSTSTAVTGSSASGTLSILGPDSGTYDIVVTVLDGAGHQRTMTETHEADTDDAGCPP
jgi:hypothetical protein